MPFDGKQFHCSMSCDHELGNEWARCSGKKRQLYINEFGTMPDLEESQRIPRGKNKQISMNKILKSLRANVH